MKKEQAIDILENKLIEFRKLTYSELVEKIGNQETFEGETQTGEPYQIEVDFFFDDEKEKTLRVTAMISYSFITDFAPVTSDFIIAPNGKYISE